MLFILTLESKWKMPIIHDTGARATVLHDYSISSLRSMEIKTPMTLLRVSGHRVVLCRNVTANPVFRLQYSVWNHHHMSLNADVVVL